MTEPITPEPEPDQTSDEEQEDELGMDKALLDLLRAYEVPDQFSFALYTQHAVSSVFMLGTLDLHHCDALEKGGFPLGIRSVIARAAERARSLSLCEASLYPSPYQPCPYPSLYPSPYPPSSYMNDAAPAFNTLPDWAWAPPPANRRKWRSPQALMARRAEKLKKHAARLESICLPPQS